MRSFLLMAAGLLLAPAVGARGEEDAPPPPRCEAPERAIVVDGDPADWAGIPAQAVEGERHLWFGQGMTRAMWREDADLAYSWRAAWKGDRLFFLVEVRDDHVVEGGAPSSFLCDCVEVYLDPAGRGGPRVVTRDGRADWFSNFDPRELKGYELHFLPTTPPRVYLDHGDKYAIERPQTARFHDAWKGEIAPRRTGDGYLLEIGFAAPGLTLDAGKELGLEVGVCDDDGRERESILMWTGTKSDFWLNMNVWGRLRLVGPTSGGDAPEAPR